MDENNVVTIEYGLSLTKSFDYSNVKPSLSVKVPIQIGTHDEINLRAKIDEITSIVNDVVHETIDQEAELLLNHDPIYATGPFLTLFRFQNPDTFYIVCDQQNIPSRWMHYIPHGFSQLRPAFMAHRVRVRFPNEPGLHDAHDLQLSAISCHELPTIDTVAYVIIDGIYVAFTQNMLPIQVTDNPEDAGDHTTLPPAFLHVSPKTVQGPLEYLQKHIEQIAQESRVYWVRTPEDYLGLWEMFGDAAPDDVVPERYEEDFHSEYHDGIEDDPYDEYHDDDDDDDDVGW